MAGLRGEEQWARRMIQGTLARPVRQHDDGSAPGMHDLDIVLADGSLAAVEVTAAADGEAIALWNLVNGRDERWIETGLRGGWFVELDPTARARAVLRDLPRLLGDLESRGIGQLDVSHRRHDLSDLEREAQRLRVNRAGQGATEFPGSIYPTIDLPLERTGGAVPTTGDPLAAWLSEFLAADARSDVRAKLTRSAAAQRHAFVIVPGFTPAPFPVVDLLMRAAPPLPTAPPALPPEVTHLWVASTWARAAGVRWSPEGGWALFDTGVEDRADATA